MAIPSLSKSLSSPSSKEMLLELLLGMCPRLSRENDFEVSIGFVDLLVLTGAASALESIASKQTVESIHEALPILIESGVNPKELQEVLDRAEAIAEANAHRAPQEA